MVLKRVLTAVVCCTSLLLASGPLMADAYRPEEFFALDLSKAVLSPKPIGPPTSFARVPVQAKSDFGGTLAETTTKSRISADIAIPKTRIVHHRIDQRRGAARIKLTRHHRNPLDAEAFDTRIQVWPCKSGGICNWKPAAN